MVTNMLHCLLNLAVDDYFPHGQAAGYHVWDSPVGLGATVSAVASERCRLPCTDHKLIGCRQPLDGHRLPQIWNDVILGIAQLPVESAYSSEVRSTAHDNGQGSSLSHCPIVHPQDASQINGGHLTSAAATYRFVWQLLLLFAIFWTLPVARDLQQGGLASFRDVSAAAMFKDNTDSKTARKSLCRTVDNATKPVFFLIERMVQTLKTVRSVLCMLGDGTTCRSSYKLRWRIENRLPQQHLQTGMNIVQLPDVARHRLRVLAPPESSQSRQTVSSSNFSKRKSEEKQSTGTSPKALRSGRDSTGNEVGLQRGSKQNAAQNKTVHEWRCLWEAGRDDKSCDKCNLTRFDSMLRHLLSKHTHPCYNGKPLRDHVQHLNKIFKQTSEEACEIFSTTLFSIMYPDHPRIPYLRFDRLPNDSRQERHPSATVVVRMDLLPEPLGGPQSLSEGRPSHAFSYPLSGNTYYEESPQMSGLYQWVSTLSYPYEEMSCLGRATIDSLMSGAQGLPNTSVEPTRFSIAHLIPKVSQLIEVCTDFTANLMCVHSELLGIIAQAEELTLIPHDARTWTSTTPLQMQNPLHYIEQPGRAPELSSSGRTDASRPEFKDGDDGDPDGR